MVSRISGVTEFRGIGPEIKLFWLWKLPFCPKRAFFWNFDTPFGHFLDQYSIPGRDMFRRGPKQVLWWNLALWQLYKAMVSRKAYGALQRSSLIVKLNWIFLFASFLYQDNLIFWFFNKRLITSDPKIYITLSFPILSRTGHFWSNSTTNNSAHYFFQMHKTIIIFSMEEAKGMV